MALIGHMSSQYYYIMCTNLKLPFLLWKFPLLNAIYLFILYYLSLFVCTVNVITVVILAVIEILRQMKETGQDMPKFNETLFFQFCAE